MSTFLAAALQLNSQPDLDYSLELAGQAIVKAAAEGASFIGLPENFAFLGNEKERHRKMDQISETVMRTLPEWSRSHGVYLLGGGFPARSESGKMYNRAVLWNPAGEIIVQYDKIHLFDITLSDQERYRESDLVEPGRMKPVVCQTELGAGSPSPGSGINDTSGDQEKPETLEKKNVTETGNKYENRIGIRVGLSICYDIRFPELYRKLTEQDADVVCIPSAFTRPTGKAHWEVLLRARAIENTVYVIAPAQTGLHGAKRKTHGHAMIVDPWGRILSDAGTAPGMALAEINMAYLREIRRKLPSIDHRVM